MRKLLLTSVGLSSVAATFFITEIATAQVVGPARRAAAAAGDAVGAPGVGDRIEAREEQRGAARADVNPDAAARQNARTNAIADADRWRYTHHNNQWWYYTPQRNWMYYRGNAWNNYDPATYTRPRYTTGYRGNRIMRRQTIMPQAAAPYSNGSPAGNLGSNLGADIGAAANGALGANQGAALGGAIGDTVNVARNTIPAVPPVTTPAPTVPKQPVPAQPTP